VATSLVVATACVAGVSGWFVLVGAGAPGIVATLVPVGAVALVAVAIMRNVGRDKLGPAVAFAGGFLLWHVAIWVIFATSTGLSVVTDGSECANARPIDVFGTRDFKPDCRIAESFEEIAVALFLTLPVVGSGVGFLARRLLLRPRR
jgi:hypothetical protein